MGKERTRNPFYGQIIRLVIPVVIQNLLSAAVSSADVVMLNYVSQDAISAVSLASQYANVLFMIYYGLGTGATMLCAQYYGKKDYMAIRAVEGIALRFSLIVSAVFAALALCVPEQMMRLFTNEQRLIELGADYLRYMSVAYLCWSVIEVYLSVLRSMERVTICMVLNMVAFGLNVLLNAVFIFGLFGAPKMGLSGVALATAISRVVELLGCILVSICSKEVKLDLRYLFIRNKPLFGDFVKLSLPALGNDVVWGVGFSMYSVILGHLGSDAVAANSLVTVVRQFGTVLCYGMASAGGILLGKLIGERQPEELIRRDASLLIRLTIACGVLGGLLVLAATPFVLRYATLSETAMGYLKTMLLINTYYITGTALNTTMICGIFRSGGDSKFGFYCDLIDMWAYAVPLGFFSAFVLRLPVRWVYFLLMTDEFVKWPFVIRHYKKGQWLRNITRDNLFEAK
ncbi:MAG: MATE family efflux transporter [Eubacteriales bacterium]|nr:MATE family efflux transporter [bacterium]MDY2791744.1 MATE family efflux transporter [Eubacteriales bacterium]